MKQHLTAAALLGLTLAAPAAAQNFPTSDPILRNLYAEGMQRSRAMTLMQVLSDSIGPRLTGTPGSLSAQEWVRGVYAGWGVTARTERYGTWIGWKRGPSHIDLMAPRVRSLEGTMLAWSPGTRGKPVQGGTVILADPADTAKFEAWLPSVKGKFVLASAPEPSCRPDSSYREAAGAQAFAEMIDERSALRQAWPTRRGLGQGLPQKALARRLEEAGAIGAITSNWAAGWGTTRVFFAQTKSVPTVGLSCEDYGLVFRLTERNQGPIVRVTAESEFLGEVPVANVIAEIKGTEKPDEYVVLSAHFDSWDGGSGSTDNGTGSIMMLEAMRILKAMYPRPRRTILAGHWYGEESGLIGSRSYAEDHPEVVKGLQALFNQDNGTGRVASVSAGGLVGAVPRLAEWFSKLPGDLTENISFSFPGTPGTGGSDNASFACYGAPGFFLGSESADYGYTWHTGRDTYDKVIGANLRRNATLVAMLAYLAAEDPAMVPRDQRLMPVSPTTGNPILWPACTKPARSSAETTR